MIGLDGLAELDLDGTGWKRFGLCAQTDPEIFHPTKGGDATLARIARSICVECPVQVICLQWALDKDERYGIWGGTTGRERERMRRQSRQDVAA